MNKKRWVVSLVVVVLIALGIYAIQRSLARRAEQKRLAEYQRVTKEYADTLPVGISRVEVENYLRTRGRRFQQSCCVGVPRNAWADLIKIGEESAPWYCSRSNVYVAFEFGATAESRSMPKALDDDKLLSVSLYQRLEDCL
jgi:hypothetical protein